MSATVVVSCYNQESYIDECLQSIVQQKTDFDFDILVADDCSTDGTVQRIQSVQEIYGNKITLIARPHNIGPSKNYINLHKQAKGDIVFHMDGDDVMLSGKLQKQYDLFRNNPMVNVAFHRAQYFSDDDSYCSDTGSPIPVDKNGLLFFDVKDLACWGTIAVHSTYAYRRASRQFVRDDADFMEWFFAMDSLLPEGCGVYLNEVLLRYRCNVGGNTYLSTSKGRLKAYKIYFNDIFYYFKKNPDLKKELYSNALITFCAMAKNRYFWLKPLFFFVRNVKFFRVNLLKDTIRMRRSVVPAKVIR